MKYFKTLRLIAGRVKGAYYANRPRVGENSDVQTPCPDLFDGAWRHCLQVALRDRPSAAPQMALVPSAWIPTVELLTDTCERQEYGNIRAWSSQPPPHVPVTLSSPQHQICPSLMRATVASPVAAVELGEVFLVVVDSGIRSE